MGRTVEISNKREEKDTMFGFKLAANGREFYRETTFIECDICHKKGQTTVDVTCLLHVPMDLRKVVSNTGDFKQIDYGYHGKSLWVCRDHLDREIDRAIHKIKMQEKRNDQR